MYIYNDKITQHCLFVLIFAPRVKTTTEKQNASEVTQALSRWQHSHREYRIHFGTTLSREEK